MRLVAIGPRLAFRDGGEVQVVGGWSHDKEMHDHCVTKAQGRYSLSEIARVKTLMRGRMPSIGRFNLQHG